MGHAPASKKKINCKCDDELERKCHLGFNTGQAIRKNKTENQKSKHSHVPGPQDWCQGTTQREVEPFMIGVERPQTPEERQFLL